MEMGEGVVTGWQRLLPIEKDMELEVTEEMDIVADPEDVEVIYQPSGFNVSKLASSAAGKKKSQVDKAMANRKPP